MRSSRISQEASRVFSRGGGSSSNSNHSTAGAARGDDDGDMSEKQQQQQVPELRRSARSSALARFAYTGDVSSSGGASAGVETSSPGVKTERNNTTTATTPKKTPKRSAATSSRTSTATTSAAPTAATTPDIEDVIPDLEQAASAASSRKRRRTTATAMAAVVNTEVDVTGAQAIGDMARTPGQRGRTTRGVVKKEEEEEEDGLAATDPALKVEETDDDLDNDEAFAPSASDTETKPVLPIRRKRERERKPARIASTATTTSSSSSSSTITTTILPPARWEETYDLLHKFRTTPGSAASNAAVDTMGCERLALSTSSARDQRFHTLIALMLSSQTKDTTNAAAMHRLHTELPAAAATPPEDSKPGLNLENILAVEPDKLNELIWAVGFHNNKTKYIKAAALICRDTWDSDIPDTFEGLVSLPGVGPKMAHLTLSAAWGRTEGIGVDVHVHRISNMWGWTGRKGTKTPEETRKYLEGWLPRDKWRDINWLMVGLGQTVCGPVSKKCGDCEIGLAGLCRAADRGKVNAGRRLRKLKEEEDEGLGEGVAEVKDEVKSEVKTDEAEAGQGVVGLKDEGSGNGNVAVKNEADAGTDSVMSAAKMEDDGGGGHNVKTEGVSSSAEVTPARVKREGGGGGSSSVVESGEVKIEIKMEE